MGAANFFSTVRDAPVLNQHRLAEDMVFQEVTATLLDRNGAVVVAVVLAVEAVMVLPTLAVTAEQGVDHGSLAKQDGMPAVVVVDIVLIRMVHFFMAVAA